MASMFVRFYDDWMTILIEPCISKMREEWPLRKTYARERLIKITQSAYRVAARRLCQPSIYSPLFEIYDGCVAVSLSCLIKPSCARMERVLRAMRRERKRERERKTDKENKPRGLAAII